MSILNFAINRNTTEELKPTVIAKEPIATLMKNVIAEKKNLKGSQSKSKPII